MKKKSKDDVVMKQLEEKIKLFKKLVVGKKRIIFG